MPETADVGFGTDDGKSLEGKKMFGGASRDRTDDLIVANDVVVGRTTKVVNHLERSEPRSIGTEWNVIQPRSCAVCLIALPDCSAQFTQQDRLPWNEIPIWYKCPT